MCFLFVYKFDLCDSIFLLLLVAYVSSAKRSVTPILINQFIFYFIHNRCRLHWSVQTGCYENGLTGFFLCWYLYHFHVSIEPKSNIDFHKSCAHSLQCKIYKQQITSAAATATSTKKEKRKKKKQNPNNGNNDGVKNSCKRNAKM